MTYLDLILIGLAIPSIVILSCAAVISVFAVYLNFSGRNPNPFALRPPRRK